MVESSIMIVCDEPSTGRIWALLLTDLKCTPIIVTSVEQAVSALEETIPELIVIDVKSREISGAEISKVLREHIGVPILLFTPVNNESHTLEAYAAGVDECVIKPISPQLFLAKIKVWLRRGWAMPTEISERVMIGKVAFEPSRHHLVKGDGKKLRLTNLEFRVLQLLVKHPNQVFSNDEIIKRVWGYSENGNPSLVKNVIYRLRKKIEPNPNRPRYICTEMDGYLFRR